ncbi:unnamed protein product [Rotaria magnacalcarata]|uniref:G-protein coupled receptors family 1 profile domain-containing protein n=2 Tax=Rotaria magnacalcarata TaxID=392030 RepID=A0A816RLK7_9BILA|nr:unnamed protein product [Rotaria magnacalcarata]
MTNSSNNTFINLKNETRASFIAYYSLALIIVGTLLNIFTFIILCQPAFKNTAAKPTIHYMRSIAIFDIIMLYGWNLDHYLLEVHRNTLQLYSIPFCKICSFLDYFTPQMSAWLRVFICLDRYLSLSRLERTWFSHSKNVLIIIASNSIVFTIINAHVLLFACFYNTDGSINANAQWYEVYPLWDYVNLGLYNCIPFILMVIFDSGVIYHFIHVDQVTTIQHRRIQHRSITITLVITTLLFLTMTTPATVYYGFFTSTTSYVILYLFDSLLYTYHILSFPLYFITLAKFRRIVVRFVTTEKLCRTRVENLPIL